MVRRADPFTHKHEPQDMIRTDNGGSECRSCGRRWFLWTSDNGHTVLLTEPRFPKGHTYRPEPVQ